MNAGTCSLLCVSGHLVLLYHNIEIISSQKQSSVKSAIASHRAISFPGSRREAATDIIRHRIPHRHHPLPRFLPIKDSAACILFACCCIRSTSRTNRDSHFCRKAYIQAEMGISHIFRLMAMLHTAHHISPGRSRHRRYCPMNGRPGDARSC